MATTKGGEFFWNNVSISTGSKSTLVYVGPGLYVTAYINNPSAVSMTFRVEVTGMAQPKPGCNALDGTADGGLTWFPLTAASGGAGAETALVVASGATAAFDLSPFGPEFIRLVRTDANAAGLCTAFVTSFGPN